MKRRIYLAQLQRRQPPSDRAGIPLAQSEKAFLQQVTDLARLLGWLHYHTWNSHHSPSGFPDLILVRRGRLIAAELKTDTGRVLPTQTEWLAALENVPSVEVHLWRPRDWDAIVETLRAESEVRRGG